MKLASSAALLSIALSASLAAQSAPAAPPPPPGPGMHFDGPGGPHGHRKFGPGMAGHHVEPIAGAPFTAQFTQASSSTDREGQQQQRSSTSMVYRDSQGRVREEITLPAPPPRTPSAQTAGAAPQRPAMPRGPRTLITIIDPVAHTITHLNAERQTAYVQTVPAEFFTRMQQRDARREAGAAPQHKRDTGSTTSLGAKIFAGVSATGEQTTGTFPAREGGSPHTFTRQTWFSPDLKVEVSSSMTSDRGTRTDTLTSLDKAEPNPSLFQVPAGYTTADAPEHRFGEGHRGRPGKGDGDGNQPPPPSM